MPTKGTRPSLEETRAIGAILLREFARGRFDDAGLDGQIIREAEETINLDGLSAPVAHSNISSCGDNINDPDMTINNNNPNATIGSVQNDTHNATNEEQYHSMAENLVDTSNNADRTLYHSLVNASHNSSTTSNNPENLNYSSVLASYGRELRKIAEEFERSPLRQSVRERANSVNLLEISKDSFIYLLEELFQGKITREKIIILFFFCTDVALRASEFAKELVVKLMGWSFTYIINTVCSIVHNMGGWDQLLFYQLPSLLISCGAALLICSLFLYLRNSSRQT